MITTVFRLGGIALAVGSSIAALVWAVHPVSILDPLNSPAHLILYYAMFLFMPGLAAMYAYQANKVWWLGLIGFNLMFIGLPSAELIHTVLSFTIIPALAADPVTAGIVASEDLLFGRMVENIPLMLVQMGGILYGIATIRAGVFPRWPAYIFLIGMLLNVISMFVPALTALPIISVFIVSFVIYGVMMAIKAPVRLRITQRIPAIPQQEA